MRKNSVNNSFACPCPLAFVLESVPVDAQLVTLENAVEVIHANKHVDFSCLDALENSDVSENVRQASAQGTRRMDVVESLNTKAFDFVGMLEYTFQEKACGASSRSAPFPMVLRCLFSVQPTASTWAYFFLDNAELLDNLTKACINSSSPPSRRSSPPVDGCGGGLSMVKQSVKNQPRHVVAVLRDLETVIGEMCLLAPAWLIRYITMCKRKMPVITPELSECIVNAYVKLPREARSNHDLT
ncbi:conserved hypothetical protein [Culex quinquefasciatus]|uniref:Uncharacterized protein n=1 Tax=Culex quinquefasciatus TaxID=7176 RepID=B0XIK6_CULQU|nr:conserved hypothetical protein [Culex quinquefasciatus]|eukprot:XP_001869478.1 conserved hypothetical protein [Culex quinquefasciatus]